MEAKKKKVPLEQITPNEAYLADLKTTFSTWKNKNHSL
jgi:hypothetical protein